MVFNIKIFLKKKITDEFYKKGSVYTSRAYEFRYCYKTEQNKQENLIYLQQAILKF